MIPANASDATLAPLSASEAERCRINQVTCSWVGCQRPATHQASYAYVTRGGHQVSTERQLCDHHARTFARRFHLNVPPSMTAAARGQASSR